MFGMHAVIWVMSVSKLTTPVTMLSIYIETTEHPFEKVLGPSQCSPARKSHYTDTAPRSVDISHCCVVSPLGCITGLCPQGVLWEHCSAEWAELGLEPELWSYPKC